MLSETPAIWPSLASLLASPLASLRPRSRSRSRSSRLREACWGWVAWIASHDGSSFTSSKPDGSRYVDSSKACCRRWEISDRTRLDESRGRSFALTMTNFWTRSMSFEAVVAIEAVTTMSEDVTDISIISFSFWVARSDLTYLQWECMFFNFNVSSLAWSYMQFWISCAHMSLVVLVNVFIQVTIIMNSTVRRLYCWYIWRSACKVTKTVRSWKIERRSSNDKWVFTFLSFWT